MTRDEAIAALEKLDTEHQVRWMISLGMRLTVSARGAYALEGQPGSLAHLMAFNEMQHQVYGRIRHLRRGEEWTAESFLDGLLARASTYRLEGELGWALRRAFEELMRS
jgi:hypothetical protein